MERYIQICIYNIQFQKTLLKYFRKCSANSLLRNWSIVHAYVFSNYVIFLISTFFSRETNLKAKSCDVATNQLGEDETALSHFNGRIICEPPNNNLSSFKGTMDWEGQKYSIGM